MSSNIPDSRIYAPNSVTAGAQTQHSQPQTFVTSTPITSLLSGTSGITIRKLPPPASRQPKAASPQVSCT